MNKDEADKAMVSLIAYLAKTAVEIIPGLREEPALLEEVATSAWYCVKVIHDVVERRGRHEPTPPHDWQGMVAESGEQRSEADVFCFVGDGPASMTFGVRWRGRAVEMGDKALAELFDTLDPANKTKVCASLAVTATALGMNDGDMVLMGVHAADPRPAQKPKSGLPEVSLN